jgi:PST family polysaccharide transporter
MGETSIREPDAPTPGQSPKPRSLGSVAARGAATTIAGQLARIGIQVTGLILLTRLLSVEDYGVLAMVTVVIGIGEVFRDFGLTTAAVQAATLDNKQRANLFWLNTGIGLVLAVIGFALAPVLGFVYGDDRLPEVMQLLSLTFLINGLSAQYRADLNRKLRFAALATVDVVSAGAGLALAIVMALADYGYWALVAQQLTIAGLGLILVVALGRWLPGGIYRNAPIGSFVRYGWNLVVAQLVTYVGRNADTAIIGARLGAAPLGLYNRAFQFILLPLNQINAPASKVAVPVLSRLRDDKERFDQFILHGQTVLLHVLVAAFAFACAQATPIILLLLDEEWAPLIPIFQVLTIAGVARAASYPTYWVALSKGLTGVSMRLALVSTPILVASTFVGSYWGVLGVAIATSAATFALWPIGLLMYGHYSDAPVMRLFINGVQALVGYGVCGVLSFLAVLPFTGLIYIAQIGIGLVAFVVAIVLVSVIWPQFRRAIVAVVNSRSLLR